ncbi:MAG: hypothetical protein LBJ00_10480, partial [Planctomycetaceae bacterium]|nr:hypothetical protein [Planctomycetaceae bacterium]
MKRLFKGEAYRPTGYGITIEHYKIIQVIVTEKEYGFDDFIVKPTSDIFIASFLSSPKNEPCLRSIINA